VLHLGDLPHLITSTLCVAAASTTVVGAFYLTGFRYPEVLPQNFIASHQDSRQSQINTHNRKEVSL